MENSLCDTISSHKKRVSAAQENFILATKQCNEMFSEFNEIIDSLSSRNDALENAIETIRKARKQDMVTIGKWKEKIKKDKNRLIVTTCGLKILYNMLLNYIPESEIRQNYDVVLAMNIANRIELGHFNLENAISKSETDQKITSKNEKIKSQIQNIVNQTQTQSPSEDEHHEKNNTPDSIDLDGPSDMSFISHFQKPFSPKNIKNKIHIPTCQVLHEKQESLLNIKNNSFPSSKGEEFSPNRKIVSPNKRLKNDFENNDFFPIQNKKKIKNIIISKDNNSLYSKENLQNLQNQTNKVSDKLKNTKKIDSLCRSVTNDETNSGNKIFPNREEFKKSHPSGRPWRLEDFSVNPKANKLNVSYSYVSKERRKEDRECLHGEGCNECIDFYRIAGVPANNLIKPPSWDISTNNNLSENGINNIIQQVSRHRQEFKQQKVMSKEFWNSDFPSTQELIEEKNQSEFMRNLEIQQRLKDALRKDGLGQWIFRNKDYRDMILKF